jgi:hypothetical protein
LGLTTIGFSRAILFATRVATVNDFVTAWNTARAGAIVGTECVVGADLAASLAEYVTTGLWKDETLGKATTNFRI